MHPRQVRASSNKSKFPGIYPTTPLRVESGKRGGMGPVGPVWHVEQRILRQVVLSDARTPCLLERNFFRLGTLVL